MTSPALCATVFLACAFTFSAAQTSCRGRCGAEYYRGNECQCDYECLIHDECCTDYVSQCTTRGSCKGRCGEKFRRGQRHCTCDSDCLKFKQCCPDYNANCDAVQEPSPNGEVEPFTFSEEDTQDELVPSATPASDPQDDVSDDASPNLPDPFSETDPDATTIPESTSGSPTDPTVPDTQDSSDSEFTLEETFTLSPQEEDNLSEAEPTQADANATPSDPTSGEAPTDPTSGEAPTDPTSGDAPTDNTPTDPTSGDSPTDSADGSDPETPSDPTSPSDSGTALPQLTPTSTEASDVSGTPTPTSELQTGPTPTDDAQSGGQPETPLEEAQTTDPTEASSGQPEISPTDPGKADDPDQASSPTTTPDSDAAADPESPGPSEPSPSATTPASSDQTDIPEATTPNSKEVPTATSPSPSDDQDPSSTAPGSEQGPESGAGGDTPDDGPGSQKDTSATPRTDTAQIADDVTSGEKTTDQPKVTPAPSNPMPSEKPSEADAKPRTSPDKPSPDKPTPKPLDNAKPPNIDSSKDFQADDSNDTNLCNGKPTSAVTTLGNGTMVVFRGHYFWTLNRNRVPGPARGITDVWGVPSPIDTAFTRCNCHGKTYILQGGNYWRFENDVVDNGYPKPVQTGFDGLRGQITAALSVPQYQTRKESVYFFKRGGLVQKYSYQFGTSPTCNKKSRVARQAARRAVSVSLEPVINIRSAWVGFPSTVTSAMSVPSRSRPEGYKYVVFSRSKYYNVRIDAERPVVSAPTPIISSPKKTAATDFFKCPKKA